MEEMEVCDVKIFTECRISSWLWKTIPTAQIVFGTFGNVLNAIILSRNKLRKISTSLYLLCLSAADLAILWTLTLP